MTWVSRAGVRHAHADHDDLLFVARLHLASVEQRRIEDLFVAQIAVLVTGTNYRQVALHQCMLDTAPMNRGGSGPNTERHGIGHHADSHVGPAPNDFRMGLDAHQRAAAHGSTVSIGNFFVAHLAAVLCHGVERQVLVSRIATFLVGWSSGRNERRCSHRATCRHAQQSQAGCAGANGLQELPPRRASALTSLLFHFLPPSCGLRSMNPEAGHLDDVSRLIGRVRLKVVVNQGQHSRFEFSK